MRCTESQLRLIVKNIEEDRRGVDELIPGDNITPLVAACELKLEDLATKLVAKGANLMATNSSGDIPFRLAIRHNLSGLANTLFNKITKGDASTESDKETFTEQNPGILHLCAKYCRHVCSNEIQYKSYIKRAAEAKHPASMHDYAIILQHEGKNEEAFNGFEEALKSGYLKAAKVLCMILLNKKPVSKEDVLKAYEYLLINKNALSPDAETLYLLGEVILAPDTMFNELNLGKDIAKDLPRICLGCLTKASELGSKDASYKLSTMYYRGCEGYVDKDDEASTRYIKLAAQQKHPEALFIVAEESEKSESLKAIKLYKESFELGFFQAGYRAVRILMNGKHSYIPQEQIEYLDSVIQKSEKYLSDNLEGALCDRANSTIKKSYALKGCLHQKCRQYGEALKDYQSAIEKGEVSTYLRLGQCYAELQLQADVFLMNMSEDLSKEVCKQKALEAYENFLSEDVQQSLSDKIKENNNWVQSRIKELSSEPQERAAPRTSLTLRFVVDERNDRGGNDGNRSWLSCLGDCFGRR